MKTFSKLSDEFAGIAAKHLSEVDANPASSNQHEIGGLPSAGFSDFMGKPVGEEKRIFPCRMVYLSDDDDESIFHDDLVTWYDSRAKSPGRGPEYRLYYKPNPVTEKITAGDLLVIAYKTDQVMQMIFAPQDSASEAQLTGLFQLSNLTKRVQRFKLSETAVSLPIVLLLEDIGINLEPEPNSKVTTLVQSLMARNSGRFPPTRVFSETAREHCIIDESQSADTKLLAYMDFEELLFRGFENIVVSEKLNSGFGDRADHVDNFLEFSLSVQNRRKSRVGHAFENHLEYIFERNGLVFEKGATKRTTENKSKPDFLFPGFEQYHDGAYPTSKITLLGAKTTCKDRWRQVLSEGERVKKKHLITLQPGISAAQLDEMAAHDLSLVVPAEIKSYYPATHSNDISTVEDFIDHVRRQQTQN